MKLSAHSLTIGYGQRVIGEALDFSLQAGEVVALLGPNGCGKTTLLKTLLGLLPALGGEVQLEQRRLDAYPIRHRARHLAYVPQSHATTFGFTVRQTVLLGRTAHGPLWGAPSQQDHDVTQRCLQRLDIEHLAEAPLHRISGGQRQLALIARALAQEPALMLLDEPTASLDFGNQGKVLRELRRLSEEGLGVIFTTHDPNHAIRYADRALLIRDGKMLKAGPAVDVLTADRLQDLYRTPVMCLEDPSKAFRFYIAE